MKLDYKILWLDDKIDIVIEEERHIEIANHLAENGFNPIIIPVKNEEQFFGNLDDSYDLILTDFHLNQTGSIVRDGDTIIKEVRKRSIFTEIMFYTAQGELVDVKKLDRITFVDTNRSLSPHNEVIVDNAKKLIDLTVKKFQHIVVMRGMIMNETSFLDAQMLNIIKAGLATESIDFDQIASVIYDDLINLFSGKIGLVEKCKENGKFRDLTRDNFVFSSDYKIKTLAQILSSLGLEDYSQSYKDEIISIRNKFAHAVLLRENGREYFKHGESGVTFDEELCKKIRIDINRHKINLDKTERKISAS